MSMLISYTYYPPTGIDDLARAKTTALGALDDHSRRRLPTPANRMRSHRTCSEARLRLTKIETLLRRRGVEVPYRTVHRFCVADARGL